MVAYRVSTTLPKKPGVSGLEVLVVGRISFGIAIILVASGVRGNRPVLARARTPLLTVMLLKVPMHLG